MKLKTSSAVLFASILLAACGAGTDTAGPGVPGTKLLAEAPTPSSSGIATFTGPVANYTVIRTANGFSVTDKVGTAGTVNLVNPTRLVFDDVGLAFDLDGNAGKAYRIYQAAFNREPDAAGLGYWIDQMDKGAALRSVAIGFVTSQEFATQYGANPTNEQVIDRFYRNVLHRDPDPAGYTYWVGVLNSKATTVANILADFGESDENKALVAKAIADGIGFIPYKPAAPLPDLNLASFGSCPTASTSQSNQFYQCMVGKMAGQTVFGNTPCNLTIAADGTITLSAGSITKTLQSPYTFPIYTKITAGSADMFFITASANDRAFSQMNMTVTSPAYAAQGGMASGVQIDLGTLQQTLSCKFAL